MTRTRKGLSLTAGSFYYVQGSEVLKFKYYITTDRNGYKIIWREGTQNHAHIRDICKVKMLLHLIELNLLPKDEYLQESCRRLLTPEEFATLKKPKDKYHNVPRGLRA